MLSINQTPIARYMNEGGPYLVLNRSLLEAMPLSWQMNFLELMVQFDEVFNGSLNGSPDRFAVTAVDYNDRFIHDPYASYLCPDPRIFQAARDYFKEKYDDPSDVRAPAH